jgi:uncharacterized protein YukE
MQYSAAGIGQLASEMIQYNQQLTGQQTDAINDANALDAVWSGGGQQAFDTQHGKLMDKLQKVIDILGGGIKGVEAALHNAQIADGKVAASF